MVLSVGVLKQKIKNKKQTRTKFKGRALHWPNEMLKCLKMVAKQNGWPCVARVRKAEM